MATTLDDIAALLAEQNNLLRQMIMPVSVPVPAPNSEESLSPLEVHRIRKRAQTALAEALARKAQKAQKREAKR